MLSEVNTIRDLGLILDRELNFKEHINDISNKSLKTLGFVLRSSADFKHTSTVMTGTTEDKTLVRCQLEHCSVVWNPLYVVHANGIERIQRKFLYHLSY